MKFYLQRDIYYYFLNKINIKKRKMDTLENIKTLVESLSVDTTKFYSGNKSAGTRARKLAQELKDNLQILRKEILEHTKTKTND